MINQLKKLISFIDFMDLKDYCFTLTPLGSGMVSIAPGSCYVNQITTNAQTGEAASKSISRAATCSCS